MGIDSPLLNETGCYVQEHPLQDESGKDTFDVLWVGKMDFRKQLGLALKTVAKSGNDKLRLHIVGGGDAESYQSLAESYGIADKCIWHGAVSHDEVQNIMQSRMFSSLPVLLRVLLMLCWRLLATISLSFVLILAVRVML